MPSRLTHKPDPQIKKNVLRARESARKAKHAHASVVVSSIAATLLAWALFSHQDAQAIEAARQANSAQAQLSTTRPVESANPAQADASQPLYAITTK